MRPPAVHRTFAYAETTFIRLRYAVDLFTAEPLSMDVFRFPGARRSGLGDSDGGSAAPGKTGKTKRPQRFHGGAFKSYARTDPSAYLPAASAINRLRCALQKFTGILTPICCQCHRRWHYSSYSLLRNLFLIDHRARSTDSSISLSTSFSASPAGGRRLPLPPHARQMLPSVGRLAFGISSRPRPLQAWQTQSSQYATAPPASSYGSR